MKIAVNKHKGVNITKATIEAAISKIRFIMAYVLRKKLMIIPTKPLPNNTMVEGSGALDFGLPEACKNTGGVDISFSAGAVSLGFESDNAANAFEFKKNPKKSATTTNNNPIFRIQF